jgi:hypothetical protein
MPAAMCAEHPDRAAQGMCARCGTFVCPACGYLVEAQIVCAPCSRRVDVGKTKHVPLVGTLLVVSGLGGTLLGLAGTAMAGVIIYGMMPALQESGYPGGYANDPYGETLDLAPFVAIAVGLVALGFVVAGAVQVIAGIFARRRRARVFVLMGLVVAIGSGLMNGMIGMLSVALGVWGFTVLTDRQVVAAFERAKD